MYDCLYSFHEVFSSYLWFRSSELLASPQTSPMLTDANGWRMRLKNSSCLEYIWTSLNYHELSFVCEVLSPFLLLQLPVCFPSHPAVFPERCVSTGLPIKEVRHILWVRLNTWRVHSIAIRGSFRRMMGLYLTEMANSMHIIYLILLHSPKRTPWNEEFQY